MLKRFLVFLICCYSVTSFTQDFSNNWKGHFSYNEINNLLMEGNKIYAAANNAIFSFDLDTNQINEFSTINGLSGEIISAIHYSEIYGLLIVGYENGLIDIVLENDENVLTIVDIIEKPTIPPNNKKINHFYEHNNDLFISTNYGISVFNLERLEFGDSYFIGDNGTQIQVNQSIVYNNTIYAACSNGGGVKIASITNPNLIDFQNWQTLFSGDFLLLESHVNKLYAINSARRIYDITNNSLVTLNTYSDTPLHISSSNNTLTVTTRNNVFVYDQNFNQTSQVNIEVGFETNYSTALVHLDNIYIGTKDFGVLKALTSNPFSFEEIHPDGPLMNVPFSVQAEPTGVWVTFGEYASNLNPYPLNSRGISHKIEDKWINTTYEDLLFRARCLNTISINPLNNQQVFISSFIDGLLEINNEIPSTLYNESNSSLEDLILPGRPDYVGDIRVAAATFDQNGMLWLMNSRIDAPLKSFNPSSNQWTSYSFTDIISDGFSGDSGFVDIVVDNNNTKWISSQFHGVIAFNENLNPKIKNISGEEKNFPINDVRSLALDNRNNLWIGTLNGLRVLYNTSNFFEDDNIVVDEIIIEEDGIAKELLFQQFITDIKVDGANNKWVGTGDSGLFYFSSDGQNTIHHFTKNNSPLPSNTVNEVSIDGNNGIVYIATSRGLVSFNSGSSSPFEDLTNAYAYPNPVRPGFNMVDERIKIKDISENVNIKITDIEGNLVAEAQSRVNQRFRGYNLEIDGGTAYWNGKNLANNLVASGVYLIMLSDLDTFETNVIKLMVVR